MYETIIGSLLRIITEQVADSLERARAEQQIDILRRAIRRRDEVISNYEHLISDIAELQSVSQRGDSEKPDESGAED